MREFPCPKGVSAESRVDHGEYGLHPRIVEIGVEGPDLFGHDEALVHDGPGGERADIELA